jgi:transcriptional/translational regulatory protein YebC/TACO1
MSGHSKWHSIKHKKGAADARRGKLFTRLIKELTIAARNGGGDPDSNPRLRTVVDAAKAANMPAENIRRAIRRGTGEEPGVSYEEVTYEGYGPGGVALLIDVLTDNKNRTVGEIRHLLSKHSGTLAELNSVAWMFAKKGCIVVDKAQVDEETLMSAPEVFPKVHEAVKGVGVEPVSAEVSMLPQNYVKLEGREAQQMLKLMEVLEDHEDTKHIWSNFDIEEKEIEASLA